VKLKRPLASFGAGLIFGVGLVIAQMTSPAKVTGFLDLFGHWDPSLAFVMIGAIGAHFTLRRLILRNSRPVLGDAFPIKVNRAIDARLVIGAAIFGIGWGLGGVCPGPGIVDIGQGSLYALVFCLTMAMGMLLERKLVPRPAR
jgi:hypothetical protein